MSWLEGGGTDGRESLKAGLDAARERTGDELTRRRIWSQVARPTAGTAARRHRWPWPAMGLLATAAVGALAFVTWYTGPLKRAATAKGTLVAARPVEVLPAESFLRGPTEVHTGPLETMRVRLRGGARIELATKTKLLVAADDAPEVKLGQVSLEVPKQAPGHRFRVIAGPYQVVVVGTRFRVSVNPENVGVEVQEGVVDVQRDGRTVRLEAGQNWTGWLTPPPQERPEGAGESKAKERNVPESSARLSLPATLPFATPSLEPLPSSPLAVTPTAEAPAVSLARQARQALNTGDTERALALLEVLSAQGGPGSENAVYEMGRIWRDHKHQPKKALELWRRYQFSHPAGLLRPEVDLSVLETLANTGDVLRALSETEAFLARYPRSERRTEVERLRQSLLVRRDRTAP